MQNSSITSAIDAYLGLGEHSYAVLIDGDWGVGKTYFIKEYLEERRDRIDQEYVLISLFGISSITDIRAAVLRSLGMTGKVAKTGADIAEGAGNLLGGIFAGDSNLGSQYTEKALKRIDKIGHNVIFVFDDIERMTIPQEEAFGFINTLIEEQARPVILIANQAKIKNQNDWRIKKEKTVGKTLFLLPDANSVLTIYLESDNLSDKTKDILSVYRKQIEASFRRSRYRNLRSLKIALQDFDQIVRALNPDFKLDSDHLAEIAQLIVILTLEVKAGSIDIDQFRDFYKLRTRRLVGKGLDVIDEEFSQHFRISTEHADVSFEAPALDYRFIADLLKTGAVNEYALNEWLVVNFGAEAIFEPSWRKLGFLQAHEPDEVATSIRRVRSDLSEFKITNPIALLEIAATAIDLRENINLFDNEDIFDFFNNYLMKIESDNDKKLELDSMVSEVFASTEFLSDTDKILFDSIHRLIESCISKQRRIEAISELTELITRAKLEGMIILQYLSDGIASDIVKELPILADTDPSAFAEAMLQSVQNFQQGCKILVARYRSVNASVLLAGETLWLKQLYEIIENEIANWPQPTQELQRRFLFNSFLDIRRNR